MLGGFLNLWYWRPDLNTLTYHVPLRDRGESLFYGTGTVDA